MTLPPLEAGGVNEIVACALPAVAEPITGAPGTPPTIPKLCEAVAGRYVELPAWLAEMVHVPKATIVTLEPVTVHTAVVIELKLTDNIDGVAVALSGMVDALNVCVPGFVKLIV